MLDTKRAYGKMDGVQYYHVIQSFKPGEVTPELALEIATEFAREHLPGFETVISVHVDKEHIHAHLIFNSVNADTGRKYHSNAKSYYEEVRKISDAICIKYGLSVIPENRGERKTLRAVAGGTGWEAYLEDSDPHGYPGGCAGELYLETVPGTDGAEGICVEMEPEISIVKGSGHGTVCASEKPGEELYGRSDPGVDPEAEAERTEAARELATRPKPKRKNRFFPQEADRASGAVLFLSLSDGGTEKASSESFLSGTGGYPPFRQKDCPDGVPAKARDYNKGADCSVPCGQRNRNGIPLKRAQEVVPGTAGFTKDQRDHRGSLRNYGRKSGCP